MRPPRPRGADAAKSLLRHQTFKFSRVVSLDTTGRRVDLRRERGVVADLLEPLDDAQRIFHMTLVTHSATLSPLPYYMFVHALLGGRQFAAHDLR